MSSALIFMLLLSCLGIRGAAICLEPPCFARCPPRWTGYDGRCYLFNKIKSTWANAESFCNLFDAHLTSIQNSNEYDFIRRLIVTATGTNTRTWVGGTNAVQNDLWMWIDGSQFTFTNWGPGEPNNNGGNEHCMEINLREQDYVNDEDCTTKNAFVCSKELGL